MSDVSLHSRLQHGEIDALLFDMDGVLLQTLDLHRIAWRQLFEPLLESKGPLPYDESDYFEHLDGRRLSEGVANILASRGIELPAESDDPSADTVSSLAEQKDRVVEQILASNGATVYPGSAAFLEYLGQFPKLKKAVVSGSRNAAGALQSAGILDQFDAVVDGSLAEEDELPGKPDPATYLRAAELLGVDPFRACVIEDAVSGVTAGRAGGFGFVVGINRGTGADALRAAGADIVVEDLAELAWPLEDPEVRA